jgi:hypothetical protein
MRDMKNPQLIVRMVDNLELALKHYTSYFV